MKAYQQPKLARGLAVVGCCLGTAVPLGAQQIPACAEGSSALTQTVADFSTRMPLAGVLITASWRAELERHVAGRTNAAGRAVLCLPAQSTVTIRASYLDQTLSKPLTFAPTQKAASHTIFLDVPGVLVRGRALDQHTHAAVPNVVVRIGNTNMTALTDVDGRFQFNRIPVGDYQLRAEHLAYGGTSTKLSLRDDDLDALIWLAPAAIPLQPIVVTAFSRRLEHVGFYERQKRGLGSFINRNQIDAMNVHAASDLLRNMPSVRLIPEPRRSDNSLRNSTVGTRGNCRFAFIVDGSRTLSDFEMDNLGAGGIEGVEIYNGLAQVPALFRAYTNTDGGRTTLCGVIAIWTRNSR